MKTFIVCNWKMNPPTFAEARGLFEETKRIAAKTRKVHFIVCPPSVFVQELSRSYKGKRILFGVQDVFDKPHGSFTGETSPVQAREAGATYVIIGHAERRILGETNELIHAKVEAALAAKLKPIICVGEHKRDSEGEYIAFVRTQVKSALEGVAPSRFNDIMIAYEPVFAIGAKESMQPHHVHEMVLIIKKTLLEMFGEVGAKITFLYGGAVSSTSARDLLDVPENAGFLLGRASLNSEELGDIVKAVEGK